MQYCKLTDGEHIIEFHNNWLGEEKVYANGKLVSRLSSIMGTNHYFTVALNGTETNYVLTSRLTPMGEVMVNLSRNGEVIRENVVVNYGSRPKKPQNKAKKEGLRLLQEFSLEEALEEFDKGLQMDAKDPEIHFHMACAYSVLERPEDGFESLRLAVHLGLQEKELILDHDMLAYIRMHPAFEYFVQSDFTEYRLEDKAE